MFENFTDRAKKAASIANQEAQYFNNEYIGTEHLFLGILKCQSCMATHILEDLGHDLKEMIKDVRNLIKSGPDMVSMGKLPHTPRAKKSIANAVLEARNMGFHYVGTEHLLIGLLCIDDPHIPRVVLLEHNVNIAQLRHKAKTFRDRNNKTAETAAPAETLGTLSVSYASLKKCLDLSDTPLYDTTRIVGVVPQTEFDVVARRVRFVIE